MSLCLSVRSIWKSVVGGKKKGRIYGLGAQGIALETQAASTPPPPSTADIERLIDTRVEARVAEMQVEMRAEFQQDLDARILQFQAEMSRIYGSHSGRGKEPVQDEDVHLDDD